MGAFLILSVSLWVAMANGSAVPFCRVCGGFICLLIGVFGPIPRSCFQSSSLNDIEVEDKGVVYFFFPFPVYFPFSSVPLEISPCSEGLPASQTKPEPRKADLFQTVCMSSCVSVSNSRKKKKKTFSRKENQERKGFPASHRQGGSPVSPCYPCYL